MKHSIEDIKQPQEKYNGIYRGVVEDNKDPLKAGRCKIRIFGIHSDNLIDLPTETLPWAQPVLNVIEGAISKYGFFGVPLQGSHVFVFFEGGNILQPRYFGAAPAFPKSSPNTSIGFNDPDGKYPDKVNQADWNEGEGEYPHNIVLSTHAGHYIEVDNTPGNERLNCYHKTGTSILIDSSGNINISVVSNETTEIQGNLSITVGGDITIAATGNVTITGARIDLN